MPVASEAAVLGLLPLVLAAAGGVASQQGKQQGVDFDFNEILPQLIEAAFQTQQIPIKDNQINGLLTQGNQMASDVGGNINDIMDSILQTVQFGGGTALPSPTVLTPEDIGIAQEQLPLEGEQFPSIETLPLNEPEVLRQILEQLIPQTGDKFDSIEQFPGQSDLEFSSVQPSDSGEAEKWYHGGAKGIKGFDEGWVTKFKDEAQTYADQIPGGGEVYEIDQKDVIQAEDKDLPGGVIGDASNVGFIKSGAKPIQPQGGEVEGRSPLKRDIGKNYREPLDSFTDTVYHETSMNTLMDLFSTGQTGEKFVTNNPDLAKGQFGKGVLMELDTKGLTAQVNTSKPTSKFAFEQGDAEFIIPYYTKSSEFGNNIKSVTVKPGVQERSSIIRRFKRDFGNWEKTTLDDGSTKYTKPPQAKKDK